MQQQCFIIVNQVNDTKNINCINDFIFLQNYEEDFAYSCRKCNTRKEFLLVLRRYSLIEELVKWIDNYDSIKYPTGIYNELVVEGKEH